MTNTNSANRPNVGRIGVWAMELRFGDAGEISETAAELDLLGYGALWIPGGMGGAAARRRGPPAWRNEIGDDRHRHPQHLDARCRRSRRMVARAAR